MPSNENSEGAEVYSLSEKRGRGRPPKSSKIKELEALQVRRGEYVTTHPLVQANPHPPNLNTAADRLNLTKHQMAKEAAVLEFNRAQLDLEGRDTSQMSSRIVATLQKISEIDLEVKKLGATVIDPRSPEVQKMVDVWIATLSETLTQMVRDDVLEPQTMDLLFNKFSGALEGWEDRVGGGD